MKQFVVGAVIAMALVSIISGVYDLSVQQVRRDNLRQGQADAARRAEEQTQENARAARNHAEVEKIDDAFASWEKAYEQLRASKQNMENTADILMRKASAGLCDEVIGTATVQHEAQFIWKKNPAAFHPFGGYGAGQKCIGANEYDFYVRCYDSRWETHWHKAQSKDLLPVPESHLFYKPLKDVDLKLLACVEPEIPYADNRLQKAALGKEFRVQ